jgi:hypothetical protein
VNSSHAEDESHARYVEGDEDLQLEDLQLLCILDVVAREEILACGNKRGAMEATGSETYR